jgi:hypothetical protein
MFLVFQVMVLPSEIVNEELFLFPMSMKKYREE